MSASRKGTLWGVLLTGGCIRAAPSLCDDVPDAPRDPTAGNFLVIISDDIGIDKTSAYGEHDDAVPMPNIEALAAEGVLFRNAWSNPTCSPSRAALMTGRHASRTGIGRWIYAETDTYDLPLDEVTLPEVLAGADAGYTSALVGKWHLVVFDRQNAARHPLDQGFTCSAGTLGNPLEALGDGHFPRGYRNWEKAVDGEVSWRHRYMGKDTTVEALARLDTLPEPWLLVVAYNDAHEPYEVPPDQPSPAVRDDDADIDRYEAKVAFVDEQVGILVDALEDDVRARTTIVYLTDNGTPGSLIEAPWQEGRGKGTIYESGVNVPLIVSGPAVDEPGTESAALVHLVDVLPTLAELAGAPQPDGVDWDGDSLVPVLADPTDPGPHEMVFTEAFAPAGVAVSRDWDRVAVRDAAWKYTRFQNENGEIERLYALPPGQSEEGDDLLAAEGERGLDDEASAALLRLRFEAVRLRVLME